MLTASVWPALGTVCKEKAKLRPSSSRPPQLRQDAYLKTLYIVDRNFSCLSLQYAVKPLVTLNTETVRSSETPEFYTATPCRILPPNKKTMIWRWNCHSTYIKYNAKNIHEVESQLRVYLTHVFISRQSISQSWWSLIKFRELGKRRSWPNLEGMRQITKARLKVT